MSPYGITRPHWVKETMTKIISYSITRPQLVRHFSPPSRNMLEFWLSLEVYHLSHYVQYVWCVMWLWMLKFEIKRSLKELLCLMCTGGRFKNTYELLNQRALKFSYVNKIHIFQCMGKIFCVEFQRYPLKFHTKYLTHTLKDMIFMQFWNFKSS